MSLLGKEEKKLSTEGPPYLIDSKPLSTAVGHIICPDKASNILVAHKV